MNRVAPEYDGGSIVNLAASLITAFGAEPPEIPCRQDLLPLASFENGGDIVLVVCDAVGLLQLQKALQSACMPNLSRLVEIAPNGIQQLTSVFPSTTTAALTSLSNACTPAAHGMMGHRQWMEELGSLCNMLRFTTEESPPATFGEDLVRAVPTVYERLAAHGVTSHVISSALYDGTEFTTLLTRGATYLGYQTQSEIAVLLDQAVSASSSSRSFHSLYWPMIDTLAHIYGPLSSQCSSTACLLEFEFIDLMLGHVADCCRHRGCSLVITADHGQHLLDPDRAVSLDSSVVDALRYPPGGGRRALYLAGNDSDFFGRCESGNHPNVSWLYADDAIARGWFGGDCGVFRDRIGDVLALPEEGSQLLFDYGFGARPQQGAHGGLSAEEMLVPLLAIPVDAW